jgi:periplasmic protein TonB
MRPSAWKATVHREFGLPVALSVGLHGLVGIALGAFAFVPGVMPEKQPGAQVDLVSLPPQPVVEPVGASSVVPAEPFARSSDPIPAFRELPRVPAPAAPPTKASAAAVTFSVPEPVESPASLTESVRAVPVSRPLTVAASGPARLLRDTTAVAGSIRSKVRSGENPRPDYPRAAREAGWEGTTVLQVLVLPDGTTGLVTLHKTSGYAVLDEAALAAVKAWRFVPAMDGNFPIKSVVRLPIRFDLKGAS